MAKKVKIRMTIEQLESLVERLKNEQAHDSMSGRLVVTMETYPNGRAFLQFEQPCCYAECNSHFERYGESDKDFEARR